MADIKSMLKLYAVTDRAWTGNQTLLEQTEAALRGGITCLQLREKKLDYESFLKEAIQIKDLCKSYNVPLIIDDRVDVALAVDAEGVHVGASDMPVQTARRLMGEDKIVGATAKTVPWALDAYSQGADYLGVGAIYPTTTKVKTVLTSVDTLRDICEAVPIPANAIGGLNKDNIDVLEGVPIAGICVVSAIMKADDPREAARELKQRACELGLCRQK